MSAEVIKLSNAAFTVSWHLSSSVRKSYLSVNSLAADVYPK